MTVLKYLSPQEAKGLKLPVDCYHYPTDIPPSEGNVSLVSGSLGYLTLCTMPEASTVEKLVTDNFETIPEQCQYPDRNSAFSTFGGTHLIHFTLGFLLSKGAERRLDHVLPLITALAKSQTDLNQHHSTVVFTFQMKIWIFTLLPQPVRSEVQSCQKAITGQIYRKIQQTIVHFLFIKHKQPTCLWMTVVLGKRWEGEMWGATNRL